MESRLDPHVILGAFMELPTLATLIAILSVGFEPATCGSNATVAFTIQKLNIRGLKKNPLPNIFKLRNLLSHSDSLPPEVVYRAHYGHFSINILKQQNTVISSRNLILLS